MSELKKCPFCGETPMLDREDIFCNCGASITILDFKYKGEAETYEEARQCAIEAWNTRASEKNERPRGEWIARFEYEEFEDAACSECGAVYDRMTKFCPNCGANMERAWE